MEIPDPPNRPICSQHGPLRWGWFPDTRQGPRWVSFYIGDDKSLIPHVCFDPPPLRLRWEPDPTAAARNARGRHLVDAAVAAARGDGPDPFTEETRA